jgi:hypothetical protein
MRQICKMGIGRGVLKAVRASSRLTLGVCWRGAAANKLQGSPCVIPAPAGFFVFSRVTMENGCIADETKMQGGHSGEVKNRFRQ